MVFESLIAASIYTGAITCLHHDGSQRRLLIGNFNRRFIRPLRIPMSKKTAVLSQ